MTDTLPVPPALVHLASVCDITTAYWDAGGTHRDVPESTLRMLLASLGVLDDADAEPPAIDAALERERLGAWRRALPPVQVLYHDEPAAIPLVVDADELEAVHAQGSPGAGVQWSIVTEEGERLAGDCALSTLRAWADDERESVDGRARCRLRLPLPALPLGYHALTVTTVAGAEAARAHLVVAPRRCHGAAGDGIAEATRVWGLAIQLYAVRSEENWGIGDFRDLEGIVRTSAALGADVLGINPLHALFAHEPEQASPYSPSSRLFMNPLYIAVDRVPGWQEHGLALFEASSAAAGTPAHPLDALRGGETIDYTAVSTFKQAAFEALWQAFLVHEQPLGTARARAFAAFRQQEGEPLARFALFEALRESRDASGDPGAGDWRRWPEGLRTPTSDAVRDFAERHAERVDFHAWLQWLAAEQLEAVAALGRRSGLEVGLYRDLAVGISAGGGDAWGDQSLFARGIHVGAPPDDFSANGQDWGLPPLDPRALREAGYEPLAAILRHNMRSAGAIRIDHVMGLARLFWIPAGESPANGAYVGYPLDDMLAVVALESQRASCIVVGEDLGTVPEGFREALAEAGVLSYKLMYFEKHYDGDQSFRLPEQYPPGSLVGADTHDLPTLRGFWTEADLELRKALDLFPEPDMHDAQRYARGEDRERLLQAMAQAGVLPDGIEPGAAERVSMDDALVLAVHRFLARSRSRLLLANVEDLLGQVEQMNLPGTDRDLYPNWRRKLPLALERWTDHRALVDTARAMSAERGSEAAS